MTVSFFVLYALRSMITALNNSVWRQDGTARWGSLLLAHALKIAGARRVTAILPYLAYAQDNKNKLGQSIATKWTRALVRGSGVDEVVALDIYSDRAEGLFSRCQDVRTAAGMRPSEIPYFEKQRMATEIRPGGFIATFAIPAVIVDDILDTSATPLSACKKLRKAGVDINIMITHGLSAGDRCKELSQFALKWIVCTDSPLLPSGVEPDNIVWLSFFPLIAQKLCVLAKA